MKLYELGKVGSVSVFFFGKKKPRPITSNTLRRLAGIRFSEQDGGLYLEVSRQAYLVKGEKVAIFFATTALDSDLTLTDGTQLIENARAGKCAILKSGQSYTIYSTGLPLQAWQGIAGKTSIKRAVHPDTIDI